jgi:basic amino acid/polyamine antiporter, APA family
LSATGELRRQLGLGSATALVVGEIIGVGIFLTPAGMAKSLGSPGLLLLVWLTMGAVALSGALCLGELAARHPSAGGCYIYLREAYGPLMAFLYGWMSLLVMDPGLTAALAMGVASYVGYLTGLSELGLKLVAVGAILVLAGVNILSVRLGAGLLRWLTAFKVGLLAFIACWGFGSGVGDWSNFVPFVSQQPGSDPLVKALAGGMVGAFFSLAGWWDLSKMAGEVRDPERTLPRALVIGVSVVTAVYILTSAVFLYLVPLTQVASNQAFAAQVGETLFGSSGGSVFSAIVIIAVLGSLIGVIMAAPRVYYAMARDGLFLPGIAVLHPRFGTPARAIAVQAVLSVVLVLSGTFDEILAYFVFVAVLFLALTITGLFVLRRRLPAFGGYRTSGYPATPLLFLVPTLGLLVLLALGNPVRVSIGVAIVILGVPVYYLMFRKSVAGSTG